MLHVNVNIMFNINVNTTSKLYELSINVMLRLMLC